jgi:hypothetical protein
MGPVPEVRNLLKKKQLTCKRVSRDDYRAQQASGFIDIVDVEGVYKKPY